MYPVQSQDHRPSRCTLRQSMPPKHRREFWLAQKAQCPSDWVRSFSWSCRGYICLFRCPSICYWYLSYFYSLFPSIEQINKWSEPAFQKVCINAGLSIRSTWLGSHSWLNEILLNVHQTVWSPLALCTTDSFSPRCCTFQTWYILGGCCWLCSPGLHHRGLLTFRSSHSSCNCL